MFERNEKEYMPNRSRVAQMVYDAALPEIEALGLELVDVEMVKSGQKRILRIYIDKRGGVSLDDCTQVSRIMDPVIDQQLEIKEHDFFEVSSPGLERPLKTDRDLARYQGEWVEVSLYRSVDGQKKYKGRLEPFTDEAIVILTDNNDTIHFPRDQVARVKRLLMM